MEAAAQTGSSAIPVLYKPSVFRDETLREVVPAGMTVAEIVAVHIPESDLWQYLRVYIKGEIVPVERWRYLRPRAGAELAITVVPGGGGNTLRMVLMVAIVVVAVAAGAWIAAPAGGMAAFGLTATGAAVAGGVATAAIASSPFLAVNALECPA